MHLVADFVLIDMETGARLRGPRLASWPPQGASGRIYQGDRGSLRIHAVADPAHRY